MSVRKRTQYSKGNNRMKVRKKYSEMTQERESKGQEMGSGRLYVKYR
jgi:hypothetical protein